MKANNHKKVMSFNTKNKGKQKQNSGFFNGNSKQNNSQFFKQAKQKKAK